MTCRARAIDHAIEPAYQAGSILRVPYILVAYFGRNAAYYHDAMMPLHGFVYTRVFIYLLYNMRLSKLFLFVPRRISYYVRAVLNGTEEPEFATRADPAGQSQRAEEYRFAYTMAVIGAGLLSLARCNDRSAKMVYLVLLFCLGHLGKWVGMKHHILGNATTLVAEYTPNKSIAQDRKEKPGGNMKKIVQTLKYIGFFERYNVLCTAESVKGDPAADESLSVSSPKASTGVFGLTVT